MEVLDKADDICWIRHNILMNLLGYCELSLALEKCPELCDTYCHWQ